MVCSTEIVTIIDDPIIDDPIIDDPIITTQKGIETMTSILTTQKGIETMTSILTKNQKKEYTKTFIENEKKRYIKLTIRYDECGNGHNSFAMTGEEGSVRKDGSFYAADSFDCLHERIAEVFPEFEKYLKWHLCSTDGPMYYVSNTIYHASDVDCWGLKKGEFRQHTSEDGLLTWRLSTPHANANTNPFVDSENCPEPVTLEYEPFGRTGTGSEPDLDAARKSAIWPNASLEELTDKNLLEERLSGLMEEFQKDVEELGFVY